MDDIKAINKDKTCSMPGCTNPAWCKTMCKKHYTQQRRSKFGISRGRQKNMKEEQEAMKKDVIAITEDRKRLDQDVDDESKIITKAEIWFQKWPMHDKLKPEDANFYKQKIIDYLKAYPDLNLAADMDCLHYIILEQIRHNHLIEIGNRDPEYLTSKDYNTAIEKCVLNMEKLNKMSAFQRRDRPHSNEGQEGDLLSLAKKLDLEQLKEEEKMLAKEEREEEQGKKALQEIDVAAEAEKFSEETGEKEEEQTSE